MLSGCPQQQLQDQSQDHSSWQNGTSHLHITRHETNGATLRLLTLLTHFAVFQIASSSQKATGAMVGTLGPLSNPRCDRSRLGVELVVEKKDPNIHETSMKKGSF